MIFDYIMPVLSIMLIARCIMYKILYKKCNETLTVMAFMYGLLLLWSVLPSVLDKAFISLDIIDFSSLSNYVGFIIQSGMLMVIELLMYRIAMQQEIPDKRNSISLIASEKDNKDKLTVAIYLFLIIEVLLQLTVVGLIPLIRINDSLILDVLGIGINLLAMVFIIKIRKTVKSYLRCGLYFLAYIVFLGFLIMKNVFTMLLGNFSIIFDIGDAAYTLSFLIVGSNIASIGLVCCATADLLYTFKIKDIVYD